MFKDSFKDDLEKYLDLEDHILRQYQIIDIIGHGPYGIVWKVQDKETKQNVALKKVKLEISNILAL